MADFFSPNMVPENYDVPDPLIEEAKELQAFLNTNDINVDLFIGGHGTTGNSELLKAYIARGTAE